MIILIILTLFHCFSQLATETSIDFNLLCKNCGHSLTSFKFLVIKKSPFSIKSWNSSLLHSGTDNIHKDSYSYAKEKGSTMIQILENPMGNQFEVANFLRAKVRMLNETKSLSDTWFPDYKWTVCLCPQCLIHIGWYFESVLNYGDYFFSLLVKNLIDDSFTEELLIQPKFKTF